VSGAGITVQKRQTFPVLMVVKEHLRRIIQFFLSFFLPEKTLPLSAY
jgi:hypothetical protein